MNNPEAIREATASYMNGYITEHNSRVRGGAPLFPKSKEFIKTVNLRELPDRLTEDLSSARGDHRDFGEDLKDGKRPISKVTVIDSLAYGSNKVGENRFRYQRLSAVIAGKGLLAAVCHFHQYGDSRGLANSPRELNKGVLFLPNRVVPFSRNSGRVEPLHEVDDVKGWINAFLSEELAELEDTVSPEADGFRMSIAGATSEVSGRLGALAFKKATNFLLGKPVNQANGDD